MVDLEFHFLIVIVPLLLSNVIHMVVVKYDFLPIFAKPIWKAGFGTNKTWRAFLIVPLLNGLFTVGLMFFINCDVNHPYLLGLILGFSYLIFELPNSYFKRRAGIKSGSNSTKYRIFVTLIDKMDSAFGVILVYYLLTGINLATALTLFGLASLTHITISYMLVLFKIKKSL